MRIYERRSGCSDREEGEKFRGGNVGRSRICDWWGRRFREELKNGDGRDGEGEGRRRNYGKDE